MAALVWLAYVAARMMFPKQVALRLGVPLLIAAVPEDAFYGINNDVLSPICFGVVVDLFDQVVLPGRTEHLTRNRNWPVDRRGVSDKARQPATDSCRCWRDFVVVHHRNSSGKTAQGNACARGACSLCRDSNRGVARLDENAFRRFHRRHLQSAIAWMDNETVFGLVVASNLHRSGNVDVPFRTNCQLLAR